MSAVDYRLSGIALVVALMAGPGLSAAPQQPTAEIVASPLRVIAGPQTPAVTALALDRDSYQGLKNTASVVLTGFPLDARRRVDLQLQQFTVFTDDARIVVGTADGDVPLPRPDVVLLRGKIAGEPDSSVFLSLSPSGSNGVIRSAAGRHIVAGGRPGRHLPTVIYDLDRLPPGAINFLPFVCGADQLPDAPAPPTEPAGGGGGPCGRSVRLAVDTDYEFTGWLFEGDVDASAAYAATLLGAVSEIYVSNVQTSLLISYLRLWTDPEDPWDQDNTINQLFEFQDFWNNNMEEVGRHTAHFLSGRATSGAGGVAYLPGLCQGEEAYGLSAHLNGSFPYPLEDNNQQNWDVTVVAHELGHNFHAPHTHAMSPPIDECGYGDCTNADMGTIMSYCHTCEGGMTNIALVFHERIITEQMLPFLEINPPCAFDAGDLLIVTQPESQDACEGEAVTLAVVATSSQEITFQWRKDEVDVPDAVNSTLVISPAVVGDSGDYDVVVTNACGSATSDPATVTVESCIPCPVIETQPSDLAVCSGDPASFSVSATGEGTLTYQWRRNGSDITGATSPTYTIPSVNFTFEGSYDVVVTNECGDTISSAATLTVNSCSCPYDFDGDDSVGVIELLEILSNWGQFGGWADLDGGGVGVTDLLIVLSNWGNCP